MTLIVPALILIALLALAIVFRTQLAPVFASVNGWVKPDWPGARHMLPVWIVIFLSWLSTTTGVVRLMQGGKESLPLFLWFVVGLLVFAATIMMVRFLQRFFLERKLWKKGVAFLGYLFLMFISVLFGFAFYWENIESRAQTFSDAKQAIVNNIAEIDKRRAELVRIREDYNTLATESARLSVQENDVGYTCEATVGAGPGPRGVFREQQAGLFVGLSSGIDREISFLLDGDPGATVTDPIPVPAETSTDDGATETDAGANFPVEDDADIDARRNAPAPPAPGSLEELVSKLDVLRQFESLPNETREDRVARQREFAEINQQLSRFENNYNALLNGSRLLGAVAPLSVLASEYDNPSFLRRGPGRSGIVSNFRCYDPQFSDRISLVVGSINRMMENPLDLDPLVSKDGPAAVREAFQRLIGTLVSLNPLNGESQSTDPDQIRAAEFRDRVNTAKAIRDAEDGEVVPNRELLDLLREAPQQRLRGADIPPLLFAIVVDMILLFWTLLEDRRRRSVLEATEDISRAYDETWNPLNLVRKMGHSISDDDYMVLQDYMIDHRGQILIAVPEGFSDDASERRRDLQVDGIIRMASVSRMATRVFFAGGLTNAKIAKYFEERRSKAAGRSAYRLWRLSPGFMKELYAALISRAGGRATPDPVDPEEETVEEDLKAADADETSSNDTYPEDDYLEAELITDDDPDVNQGETPVQSSEKLTLEDADEASERQN